jgi:hypothetical protein
MCARAHLKRLIFTIVMKNCVNDKEAGKQFGMGGTKSVDKGRGNFAALIVGEFHIIILIGRF